MILLFGIGLIAGIISGMGIGGGAILIPALTFFFGFEQQAAQHMNLIYFIPTAVVALFTHVRSGNIETHILPRIIFFGLIGAVIGSMVAIKISPEVLRRIFGIFLLCIGIMEFFKKKDCND